MSFEHANFRSMYEKMAAQITAATLVLKNQATAAADIDRILTTMMIESRPVYVGLSVDVGYLEVDDVQLKTPLSIELPQNDKSVETAAVAELRSKLEKANHPIIIVDGSKRLNDEPNMLLLTARRHGSQQSCCRGC
jgi:pyruvate decarboxylase